MTDCGLGGGNGPPPTTALLIGPRLAKMAINLHLYSRYAVIVLIPLLRDVWGLQITECVFVEGYIKIILLLQTARRGSSGRHFRLIAFVVTGADDRVKGDVILVAACRSFEDPKRKQSELVNIKRKESILVLPSMKVDSKGSHKKMCQYRCDSRCSFR